MSHIVDVVAAVMLVVFGLFGYFTGAIVTVFYVLSGFAGVIISRQCAAALHVNVFWCFVLVTVVLIAVGMLLRTVARVFLLGGVDRLIGCAMGLLVGVLLLCLVLEPAIPFFPREVRTRIVSSYVSTRLIPWVRVYLPNTQDVSAAKLRLSLQPDAGN